MSPEGRKVKVYELTTAGRKQFLAEQEQWRAFSLADGSADLALLSVAMPGRLAISRV